MVINLIVLTLAMIFAFAIGWTARHSKNEDQRVKKEGLKYLRDRLQDLRNQVPCNSGWGENIRKDVTKGKLSYEDLGTTEEELKQLASRLQAKESALRTLSDLRRGTNSYKESVEKLPKYLASAGLKLEDIGSSTNELDSFVELNKKILTQYHLQQFRNEMHFVSVHAQWLLHFKKQGVDTSAIGLSAKEESLLPALASI